MNRKLDDYSIKWSEKCAIIGMIIPKIPVHAYVNDMQMMCNDKFTP